MSAVTASQLDNKLIPLFGHRDSLTFLKSRFDNNRLHHGLLLSGEAGIGKTRLALQLAGWILSKKPQEASLFEDVSQPDPDIWELSEDSEDMRLVFQNAHPDMMMISSEQTPTNKSGQIKAEHIRGLSHFLAHSSTKGGWRVAVIDSLDATNIHAANAMLKLLEEPPAHTLLILLSSRPGTVLPTILSRCVQIKLKGLDLEETKSVLRYLWPDADEHYLNEHANLCDGVPGQAVALSEAGCIELFAQTCSFLSAESLDHVELVALSEQWGAGGTLQAKRRHAALFLFERLLSHSALLTSRADISSSAFLHHPEALKAAQTLSNRLDTVHITELYRELIDMITRSERLYLDLKPMMTEFFVKLHSQRALT